MGGGCGTISQVFGHSVAFAAHHCKPLRLQVEMVLVRIASYVRVLQLERSRARGQGLVFFHFRVVFLLNAELVLTRAGGGGGHGLEKEVPLSRMSLLSLLLFTI